jgi:hypothetical protein
MSGSVDRSQRLILAALRARILLTLRARSQTSAPTPSAEADRAAQKKQSRSQADPQTTGRKKPAGAAGLKRIKRSKEKMTVGA